MLRFFPPPKAPDVAWGPSPQASPIHVHLRFVGVSPARTDERVSEKQLAVSAKSSAVSAQVAIGVLKKSGESEWNCCWILG